MLRTILIIFLAAAAALSGASPANVLIVINDNSSLSRSIGEYYARRRAVPMKNVCRIHATEEETIPRAVYDSTIAAPIADCLRSRGLTETILYLVTTAGVPLRIDGSGGIQGDCASVDSELTLLYASLQGRSHPVAGPLMNPFFGRTRDAFSHPRFPMYLVTRLAGYDFSDVKNLIDRSLAAANRGKFVIDMKSDDDQQGNDWLRKAAVLLPKNRVVFDHSPKVLYNERDAIGYASWGSNDPNRHRRFLGFQWLPGAIMTEYVSTNARTFKRPPDTWNLSNWNTPKLWFAGSPQTLTADYVHEGVSGASGHVFEPYLTFTPRPDYLLPAYYAGRNLAESYYLAIPALSWQNIVVGDPLCNLGKPK